MKKSFVLSNHSILYTWKNIKSLYRSNRFKVSAPTWNDNFQLPDRFYFLSDIQDYFEYFLRKHEEKTQNPSIKTYVNKIEIRITLKIKTGYYLGLLTPEKMKLPERTKIR